MTNLTLCVLIGFSYAENDKPKMIFANVYNNFPWPTPTEEQRQRIVKRYKKLTE